MDHLREQSIALAGLWQAANIVYDLAHNEELDRQQTKRFQCSARSILRLDAENAEQVYDSVDNLQFSVLGLYGFIKRKHKGKPNVLHYMAQMLRLQKRLTRDAWMSAYIGEELLRLKRQQDFYQGQEPVLIENMARVYSESFGTLAMRQRIKVQGNPQILQKTDIQNAIRTMLLAGVRAAMLWRQMHGSRLQLILHRKQVEKSLANLVAYI